MKTVSDLTAWIESQHPIGETTNGLLAVTGEPYVVLGPQYPGMPDIFGTKNEGAEFDYATDEETAVWQARACFEMYQEDRRSGTLYWRVRPDLFVSKDRKRWGVYIRLLISDKKENAHAA